MKIKFAPDELSFHLHILVGGPEPLRGFCRHQITAAKGGSVLSQSQQLTFPKFETLEKLLRKSSERKKIMPPPPLFLHHFGHLPLND